MLYTFQLKKEWYIDLKQNFHTFQKNVMSYIAFLKTNQLNER